MYDELVKRLREVADEVDSDYDVDPYNAEQRCLAILQAADAIEKLLSRLQNAINRASAGKGCKDLCAYLPKWIPVTERLPEPKVTIGKHVFSTDVLGTEGFAFRIAYYNYTAKVWLDGSEEQEWPEITHWMPLPQPPKEEIE